MNKTELAKRISENMSVTCKTADRFIEVFEEILETELKGGNAICLQGFGSFLLWQQTERLGRNPKTGNPVTISARNSVKFKPGKSLLENLNNDK